MADADTADTQLTEDDLTTLCPTKSYEPIYSTLIPFPIPDTPFTVYFNIRHFPIGTTPADLRFDTKGMCMSLACGTASYLVEAHYPLCHTPAEFEAAKRVYDAKHADIRRQHLRDRLLAYNPANLQEFRLQGVHMARVLEILPANSGMVLAVRYPCHTIHSVFAATDEPLPQSVQPNDIIYVRFLDFLFKEVVPETDDASPESADVARGYLVSLSDEAAFLPPATNV